MNSKKCRKCNELKPLSEYYRHKKCLDGTLNECKACKRKTSREYAKKYSKTESGKAVARRAKYAWIGRNPRKKAAHYILRMAIRAGKVSRLPCETCGSISSQAHHENYDNPVEVVWLCAADHKRRHIQMDELGITP